MGSMSIASYAALGRGALLLLAAVVAGCDRHPSTYPVTGTVRFRAGDPVVIGSIEFRSDTGQIARGRIDAQGAFSLGTFADDDGAVAGRHRVVVVQTLRPDHARQPGAAGLVGSHQHADESSHEHGMDHEHEGHQHEHHEHDRLVINMVALHHAHYETSGLVAEVSADQSNVIELTVDPMTPPRTPRP
jgi:hypothetical protein